MKTSAYHIDCMDAMGKLPDNHWDLALCDVPYGINVGKMAFLSEKGTTIKQKNGSRLNPNKNKKGYSKKEWDDVPPPQEYFDELRRISRHQIIFGVEYVDWTGLGSGRIKWNKGVAEGVSFKKYELAYCSMIDYTRELDLLWAGMNQAKSLSEPMTQQGNKKLNEKRIHPCHKPVLLYKRLLLDYAIKGWRIGDTHLGSGSSRIAAYDLGYDFEGFEKDKEHFNDQEKRFATHISQIKLVLNEI
jgi:site-specific DNA-methyltransferase (adenine-specific)